MDFFYACKLVAYALPLSSTSFSTKSFYSRWKCIQVSLRLPYGLFFFSLIFKYLSLPQSTVDFFVICFLFLSHNFYLPGNICSLNCTLLLKRRFSYFTFLADVIYYYYQYNTPFFPNSFLTKFSFILHNFLIFFIKFT